MRENLFIRVLYVGEIDTDCYIVRNGQYGKDAVIVDPGGDPEEIIRELEETESVPSVILLTHGHYDHILAVNEIKAAYPSVRVMMGEAERPMMEDPSLNCNFFGGTYTVTPDVYLKDGEELNLLERTFRVMFTPGHTAGSVCYYLPEEDMLFSGDTLFRSGCGRVDLPTGDERVMMKTLQRLLTTMPKNTDVLPGHGAATSILRERMVQGADL